MKKVLFCPSSFCSAESTTLIRIFDPHQDLRLALNILRGYDRKMKAAVVIFFVLIGIIFFTLNLFFGVFQDVGKSASRVLGEDAEVISDEEELAEIERIDVGALLQEPENEILTPEPLRAPIESNTETPLTQLGVLQWTNSHRESFGMLQLTESELLSSIAQKKLQDMFEKQYFAHVSPSGVGVSDLAEDFGYEFIAIGENLALGNYENDEGLVQAWMNSPGHRENILNTQYEEIGIAVGEGIFDGDSLWLAVQTFGRSLSACPQPMEALKEQIDIRELEIKELETIIDTKRAELKPIRPKRGAFYRQKVEQYNTFITRYNDLIADIQELITQYNSQVEIFNKCARK